MTWWQHPALNDLHLHVSNGKERHVVAAGMYIPGGNLLARLIYTYLSRSTTRTQRPTIDSKASREA